MKIYNGPLTVRFYIEGREVTKEEVIQYLRRSKNRDERRKKPWKSDASHQ